MVRTLLDMLKSRPAGEVRLVRAFYKAEPLSEERGDILKKLNDISVPEKGMRQIELNQIAERRERLKAEFSIVNQTGPIIIGTREGDIDREMREMIWAMPDMKGTAKVVVLDRIGTLCAERSFRMIPRRLRSERHLDRALNPRI